MTAINENDGLVNFKEGRMGGMGGMGGMGEMGEDMKIFNPWNPKNKELSPSDSLNILKMKFCRRIPLYPLIKTVSAR